MDRRSFITGLIMAGPTMLAAKECVATPKPKLLEAHFNQYLGLGDTIESAPSMMIVFVVPQTDDPGEINFVSGHSYQFERTFSDGITRQCSYQATCVHEAPDNAVIGVYDLPGNHTGKAAFQMSDAVRKQAEDRCHRRGTPPNTIYLPVKGS